LKIAISGLSGCGNTTVSKLVAKKLRCRFLNYTLRNLAAGLKKPFPAVQKQAEKSPVFDYAVDKKQAILAASSPRIVVGSRLACWLDSPKVLGKLRVEKAPSFNLKAWLDAPLRVRAGRIAKREGKSLSLVLRETRARDAANAARYKRLYEIDVSNHSGLFVVDVSKISAEQAADRIVEKVIRLK